MAVESSDAISVTTADISEVATPVSVTDDKSVASGETIPEVHSYQIKPTLLEKFKAEPVKEIIRNVLTETLAGKSYEADHVQKWTVKIANEVSSRVMELKMNRYKHIVQVVLGEQKGAGCKSGIRCLWDAETDSYTSDVFTNESIFCLTVVYAVYLY